MDIRPSARALLKPNATVTLAVHCHQTTGGQNIDVGLVNVAAVEPISSFLPSVPRELLTEGETVRPVIC